MLWRNPVALPRAGIFSPFRAAFAFHPSLFTLHTFISFRGKRLSVTARTLPGDGLVCIALSGGYGVGGAGVGVEGEGAGAGGGCGELSAAGVGDFPGGGDIAQEALAGAAGGDVGFLEFAGTPLEVNGEAAAGAEAADASFGPA